REFLEQSGPLFEVAETQRPEIHFVRKSVDTLEEKGIRLHHDRRLFPVRCCQNDILRMPATRPVRFYEQSQTIAAALLQSFERRCKSVGRMADGLETERF